MTRFSRLRKKQAQSSPGPAKGQQEGRKTPLWQAVVLPVAAVLITFLLLEAGLALFGVKPALRSEDPFVGFAADVPLFVPASGQRGEARMITAPNKHNFFNAQSFDRDKKPGTFRIFTLGGSTTYGRPYDDLTSFTGWLRELLPAAQDTTHWEVINAGGISYASYRVAHVMEELVNYAPDLFIIYTGHNEFLEERTYGEIRDMPVALRKTISVLSQTRTWSAMNSALQSLGVNPQIEQPDRDKLAVEVDAILDKSVGLEKYTRDDPLKENILKHYRVSLERMVALAKSAGAEVVFVTPASALKDCTPFKSEHTPGLDPKVRQRVENYLGRAKELLRRDKWNEALELLDTAAALDPRHAMVQYRRAQALLALGRYAKAEEVFRIARDEDVCPLRALTPIRRIVAEVAEEYNARLVDYVGLIEQRMREIAGHPIAGEEFFLDHVHPTIEGHKILGIALVEDMAAQGLLEFDASLQDAIARATSTIEAKIDPETHGQALANLARLLKWAGKIDDAERSAIKALEVGGEHRQVAVDAASILTSVYQHRGELEKAAQLLHQTLEKAPGAVEPRLKLGQILLDPPFKQHEKAAANLLLVCQQMPDYGWGHTVFGAAMARIGRLDIAYASLMEALRLNPKNATAKQTLNWIRPSLKGQKPNSQPPRIMLDIYPSRAPRMLVQVRQGPGGRPVPHGIQVEFYENGRVKRYLDMNEGRKHGFELTWDENGRLLSRLAWRNGNPLEQATEK